MMTPSQTCKLENVFCMAEMWRNKGSKKLAKINWRITSNHQRCRRTNNEKVKTWADLNKLRVHHLLFGPPISLLHTPCVHDRKPSEHREEPRLAMVWLPEMKENVDHSCFQCFSPLTHCFCYVFLVFLVFI